MRGLGAFAMIIGASVLVSALCGCALLRWCRTMTAPTVTLWEYPAPPVPGADAAAE